jgi:glutamate--cysteine ligase
MLDVFLLHCLLADSPPDTPTEIAAIGRNQNRVAARGREPGLHLERQGKEVALLDWGQQLTRACEPIALALDAAHASSAYSEALAGAVAALHDPARVPSARVLREMQEHHAGSYIRFTLAQSARHAADLRHLPVAAQTQDLFARLARESLEEQQQMEASDTMPFETYRQRYLAPERLNASRSRARTE